VIGKDEVKLLKLLKVLAVKEFPQARISKSIKQFEEFARYYRWFIPNFSKIAKPLTNLLKKDEKFIWNETQDQVFREL